MNLGSGDTSLQLLCLSSEISAAGAVLHRRIFLFLAPDVDSDNPGSRGSLMVSSSSFTA